MMKRAGYRVGWGCARFAFVALLGVCPVSTRALPQSAVQAQTDARIAALDKSLEETRAELSETRAEIRQLHSLLEEMNRRLQTSSATTPSSSPQQVQASPQADVGAAPTSESQSPPARISQDDWQVLKMEVQQQAQEKVESGSKYHLKLWGLALFNAFYDNGRVDNLDVPTLALDRSPGSASGSLGASLRQSIVGITGFGPDLFGARTSADLQMDFFGGLPSGYGGGSSGIFRLRLARIRLDWDHTSVVGGLDTPFFSPNAPSSFMSVAVPAFASAGNLWAWSPTVRVERRFDAHFSQLKIEAGLLAPSSYAVSGSSKRQPTPGESSRQPVYAVRFSANGSHGDRPPSVGVSGIYFPESFPGGAAVSGWGSLVDWRFPVFPRTELSGELFVGKGLDAFGGVPVPAVRPEDYNEYIELAAPALARITMLGGWSQLKFTLDSRNEFNVGVGTGGRNASEVAQEAVLFPPFQYLSPRDEMMFVNYIFRPRSDLLFSPEYRRLRTYPIYGAAATASQIGLAAGFLF
jgi:hypothetical protein